MCEERGRLCEQRAALFASGERAVRKRGERRSQACRAFATLFAREPRRTTGPSRDYVVERSPARGSRGDTINPSAQALPQIIL